MTSLQTNKNAWTPESWQVRVFNWHLLRGFGQSLPASITMATPFVGYMILYHSQIEQYMGGLGGLLDEQVQSGTCEPWFDFSTRLNIVYVGLLLLGVGTILYRIFAPAIVKRARDINEYVLESIDNVSARNLRSMYVTIQSRRPQVAASFDDRAPWLDRKMSLKTASDALKKTPTTRSRLMFSVASTTFRTGTACEVLSTQSLGSTQQVSSCCRCRVWPSPAGSFAP